MDSRARDRKQGRPVRMLPQEWGRDLEILSEAVARLKGKQWATNATPARNPQELGMALVPGPTSLELLASRC